MKGGTMKLLDDPAVKKLDELPEGWKRTLHTLT